MPTFPKLRQNLTLSANEVHVWLTEPAQCHQAEWLEAYLSWLDQQERSRYERFHFPHHRHEYLVAHALLRSTLSHYGFCAPKDWSFIRNAYGRPELQVTRGQPPLRFNLSHTAGLVACAVTRTAAVGVDVEGIGRVGDLAAIAEMNFTPEEQAELNTLNGIPWTHRFFQLWTLKEAYIKAKGQGLSIPLEQIQFQIKSGAAGKIRFTSPRESDSAQNWQFALLDPTPEHCLALAMHLRTPWHLQTGWTIPGVTLQAMSFPCITS